MNLPFRLARGIAVVISIVSVHAVIFWLFNHMQIRVPSLGPVFATLLADPAEDSNAAPAGEAAAASAPAAPSEPPANSPRN